MYFNSLTNRCEIDSFPSNRSYWNFYARSHSHAASFVAVDVNAKHTSHTKCWPIVCRWVWAYVLVCCTLGVECAPLCFGMTSHNMVSSSNNNSMWQTGTSLNSPEHHSNAHFTWTIAIYPFDDKYLFVLFYDMNIAQCTWCVCTVRTNLKRCFFSACLFNARWTKGIPLIYSYDV